MFSVTHARRQCSTQLSHEIFQKNTSIATVYVFVFSQILSSRNRLQPQCKTHQFNFHGAQNESLSIEALFQLGRKAARGKTNQFHLIVSRKRLRRVREEERRGERKRGGFLWGRRAGNKKAIKYRVSGGAGVAGATVLIGRGPGDSATYAFHIFLRRDKGRFSAL